MEDVWCGEWSSTAVIGTVSLERWKNGRNVKLTDVYSACSRPFIALKYLNLGGSDVVCAFVFLSSCLRGSVCVWVCVFECQRDLCECVLCECECQCVCVCVCVCVWMCFWVSVSVSLFEWMCVWVSQCVCVCVSVSVSVCVCLSECQC